MEADDERVRRFVELRRRQQGVFSRAQAVAHGIDDGVLARRCRNRQIERIHQGVYADFTGPLPWSTRVWAAWLACGPEAALTADTALRWHGLSGDWQDSSIRLAVPQDRRIDRRTGIRITRHQDFRSWLLPGREPHLVRLEIAVLTAAASRVDPDRRAALVLDACRQRRTTPDRLLAELTRLPRLRGRTALLQILTDAATGVQSFLERIYLTRVERAHGLPTGDRQVRAADGTTVNYRDVEYLPHGVIVELDGRAGHADASSTWRDMHRDNAATLHGKTTLRFGYQLVTDPCAAAGQVGAALALRGWPGTITPCSPTCSLGGEFSRRRWRVSGAIPGKPS
ncbi:type IV toxin-antitoxin system AbiEi family antitoxin domain-containing protein [Kribbella sp. NBC_00709]|uniref:type IV toxin-antitoxin system AbiEi family antitoxin domain-containing protein n=1 Tax=Kribbella sp. NBC_00709 TaxID=2975972 RepID=UPI002E2D14E1|nr:type IV toxin-antitoxin system AbiEi family antitoxin domain-containing protein [Kribbella sp. NBC_00709]